MYGAGGNRGVVTSAYLSPVGILFGDPEKSPWRMDVDTPDGLVRGVGSDAVHLIEDAERWWHVVDTDDRIRAGGGDHITEERAREIAARLDGDPRYGDSHRVIRGLPGWATTYPTEGALV
jgi:hypothetical protein